MGFGFSPGTQRRLIEPRDIYWHTEKQAISIEGTTIPLTTTEYRLLFPLRHGEAITYTDLAALTYCYEADEQVRMMMDKHIDRIRAKLRGTGIYVYCVVGYGYVLLPEAHQCKEETFPVSECKA